MNELAESHIVDVADHLPVRAPFGISLGGHVQPPPDRHRPVGSAIGLVWLQTFDEFVCPGDHAFLPDPRYGPMDLEEAHADVESETPVGGEGDYACIGEKLIAALIEEYDVLLNLTADVAQGLFGQCRVLAIDELLGNAEDVVLPAPALIDLLVQAHSVWVCDGEFPHQREHRVTCGRAHMRQHRTTCGISGEDGRTLGE